MPEGSSSAAPVTNPGPSNRKSMFLGFLGGPEDADSVISTFGADSCGRARLDQAIRTADPGGSCWNGRTGRKLQRLPATRLAVDDNRPTGQPTARSSARHAAP